MSDLYQAADGVVWRPLDDGLVLLDTGRGHYFELNASGRRMFELICAGQSLPKVICQLQNDYRIDPERLREDMQALCAELLAQGLIVENCRAEG